MHTLVRRCSFAFGLLPLLLASNGTVGQQPGPAMRGPDAPCADSIARGDCPLTSVSLVQLLATPERFDGRHVRVVAFVHLEFEGNAAYLHREDFEANLESNAIWVDFRAGTLTAAQPVNDRYVLLEGIFDAEDHGHMGLFGGTLRDITRADPWPSRTEIRKRFKVLRVPAVVSVADRLAGCYRLTVGPWSKTAGLGPPSPTEIVRLDTTSIRNGIPGGRTAVRLAPAELMPSRYARTPSWRMSGRDSIEIITWSTGTESEAFYGHVAGADLRGVLRHTSDAIPTDPKTGRVMWDVWPWAQATARRVPCP